MKKRLNIKGGEINLTFRQKRDKEMKGLAGAEEQRGKGRDFKARERNYRQKSKRGGGLVMGERWQDMEKGECQRAGSETQ